MNLTFDSGRTSLRDGAIAIVIGLLALLGTTGCGYSGKPGSFGNSATTGGGSPFGSGTSSGGGSSSDASVSAAAPVLTMSSTSVSFGNVTVGTSTTQLVTLTNKGGANLSITKVYATGTGFSESGGADMTLAAGQAVTVSVSFAPAGTGVAQGGLSIFSNATATPLQIGLSGDGIAPVAAQHIVNLNWQASATAAVGYFVYRGADVNSLAKLNTSADPATTYADSTVVSGQTYMYAVTSLGSDNVESAQSSPITVTIPAQ